MYTQFVEHGLLLFACEMPEAPREGQFVRVGDKYYKVGSVTWDLAPYPTLVVGASERIGRDRPARLGW